MRIISSPLLLAEEIRDSKIACFNPPRTISPTIYTMWGPISMFAAFPGPIEETACRLRHGLGSTTFTEENFVFSVDMM